MAIEHLSKWDFANEFMFYEAAALMSGIDPAEIHANTEPAKDNDQIFDFHEHPKIKPVAERMKEDCNSAHDLYSAMRKGEWKHSSVEPASEFVLRTREMEVIPLKIGSWCLPLDQATQAALDAWHASEVGYEDGKFTRTELSRWLSANRLRSEYQFDLIPVGFVSAEMDKPIGTKERNTLLTIIAVLCKEAKLDCTKHAKTAGLIQSTAAGMGVSIGESTIEGHLKKISDALAGRMK